MDYVLIKQTVANRPEFVGLTKISDIYQAFIAVPMVDNPEEQQDVLPEVVSISQIMQFLTDVEKANLLSVQGTNASYFSVMSGAVLAVTADQNVIDCINYGLQFLFETNATIENNTIQTTTTMHLVELAILNKDRTALHCITEVLHAAGSLSSATKTAIQDWLNTAVPDPNWPSEVPGQPVWQQIGLRSISEDDVQVAMRI